MSGTELERFRKKTRWVYYSEGVAYGPFSVDEIFDMIDEGVVNDDTDLMELGSRRRIPLRSVRLFTERVLEFETARTREMDALEFEGTRQRLGRSRGIQFYVVNIALPIVLVLAVILGVFWKQIFGTGGGEGPGAVHIAEDSDSGNPSGEATESSNKAPTAEPEFVEAEASLEAGLEDYALGLTMEGADDRSPEALGHIEATARAKKLPEVIPLQRRKPTAKVPGPKDDKPAGGPASTVDRVVEMDFSDGEPEDEAVDLADESVEAMVRRRLQPVLRSCAGKGAPETGLPPDVLARVQVRPSGSLGSLKLTVEPKVGYSEIRMCVIAGMAGIRVPPFVGAALQVTTTN